MVQTKEQTNLISEIAEEHYGITDSTDANLNYLWWMYYKGVHKDNYRPFIYMAELQLLKSFNYINDKEIKNVVGMMDSKDLDNLHIVTLTITNLRNLRIKEHGKYSNENDKYFDIKSKYPHEVLSHDLFIKILNKK